MHGSKKGDYNVCGFFFAGGERTFTSLWIFDSVGPCRARKSFAFLLNGGSLDTPGDSILHVMRSYPPNFCGFLVFRVARTAAVKSVGVIGTFFNLFSSPLFAGTSS